MLVKGVPGGRCNLCACYWDVLQWLDLNGRAHDISPSNGHLGFLLNQILSVYIWWKTIPITWHKCVVIWYESIVFISFKWELRCGCYIFDKGVYISIKDVSAVIVLFEKSIHVSMGTRGCDKCTKKWKGIVWSVSISMATRQILLRTKIHEDWFQFAISQAGVWTLGTHLTKFYELIIQILWNGFLLLFWYQLFQQLKILHMSWQQSCHGICKILTWSGHYIKIVIKLYFLSTRYWLWSRQPLVKWAHGFMRNIVSYTVWSRYSMFDFLQNACNRLPIFMWVGNIWGSVLK